MAKARRFAEGTTVEVGKSRMEVEELLHKHGAVQVIIGTDREKGGGFVHFALGGRQYRLMVPKRDGRRNEMQIERERWRALLLLLKAKLEVVASEMVTMEQEFLAYVMLPNGRTVGSEISEALEASYQSGEMPKLLPEGS